MTWFAIGLVAAVGLAFLLERLDDHLTLLGKDVLKVAELATAVGQTVAANQLIFVRGIPRERVGHDQRFVQVCLALL